jgi:hypothetical protein
MEEFPHPQMTYKNCLTTFICSGWAHGAIIMPVCPDLERQLKPVTLLGHEQQYLTVAEALNQHGRMIPTSTDDI